MIKKLIARAKAKPTINTEFGEFPIVIHFGYHKCLTVYVNKILSALSDEYHFRFKQFRRHHQEKIEDYLDERVPGIYAPQNNPYLELDKIGPYRASHFIRNPRDLVVSGYKYHLWTDEDWCVRKDYRWKRITKHEAFRKYIEPSEENFPSGVSYQEYLNSLDKFKGLILEIIRNYGSITHMGKWDYNNPNVIEIKYEDIIGNEGAVFERIFDHYGLNPEIRKRGVELAEAFSLKNMKKEEKTHVRDGSLEQWRKGMETEHVRIFDELYPDVMDKLGYSK